MLANGLIYPSNYILLYYCSNKSKYMTSLSRKQQTLIRIKFVSISKLELNWTEILLVDDNGSRIQHTSSQSDEICWRIRWRCERKHCRTWCEWVQCVEVSDKMQKSFRSVSSLKRTDGFGRNTEIATSEQKEDFSRFVFVPPDVFSQISMKNQMQPFASQTKLNKTIFSNIPGILLDHSYVNYIERERQSECVDSTRIFLQIWNIDM